MVKICNKCGKEKELSEFYKRKDNLDGYRNNCKKCQNFSNIEGNKKYFNKDSTKVKMEEYNKKYWMENKENLTLKNKEKYTKNKDLYLQDKKDYYLLNKELIISKNIKYKTNRLKTDPLFRSMENSRKLIRSSFIAKGYKKNTKTETILGISLKEFLIYLESKFETWMNWNNYGKYNGELNHGWDIDHIIPVSSAISEKEVTDLNNYLNLQPLCSKINRDIKRNLLTY